MDMDNWYIMPRSPDLDRGEQVRFDWPHQGDAKLVADVAGKIWRPLPSILQR